MPKTDAATDKPSANTSIAPVPVSTGRTLRERRNRPTTRGSAPGCSNNPRATAKPNVKNDVRPGVKVIQTDRADAGPLHVAGVGSLALVEAARVATNFSSSSKTWGSPGGARVGKSYADVAAGGLTGSGSGSTREGSILEPAGVVSTSTTGAGGVTMGINPSVGVGGFGGVVVGKDHGAGQRGPFEGEFLESSVAPVMDYEAAPPVEIVHTADSSPLILAHDQAAPPRPSPPPPLGVKKQPQELKGKVLKRPKASTPLEDGSSALGPSDGGLVSGVVSHVFALTALAAERRRQGERPMAGAV